MKVRAKKHLGQHFLTDLGIAQRIAASLMADGGSEGGADDAAPGPPGKNAAPETPGKDATPGTPAEAARKDVLEVGCGTGVLTQYLLQREDITLYGVEVDSESIAYLTAHFPAFVPRLLEADFLRMDLAAKFPHGVRIIGNFPYNISSQIFFRVLEFRNLVPEVVGMLQREVALRIASPPGNRDYGILSVLLQAWYDIEYLFTVSEGVFSPPPKVKSAVVRLVRNGRTALDCDEALFVKVVKASFGQRRKMLRNALRAVFGDFGGAEHRFFTLRAEVLGVDDFVELTRWVAERMNAKTEGVDSLPEE